MKKLILGTAQFGMDYGINNKRVKVAEAEVFHILERAVETGVDTIDTAHAYGESESIIGKFIAGHTCNLNIISKLPPGGTSDDAQRIVSSSLARLNVTTLYGYLIHDFQDYIDKPEIWTALERLKGKGLIKKIGFSLYYPREAEYLLKKTVAMDLVQLPYSIFDQRFVPYFSELKKKNIEVCVRSVFLQGLVFKRIDELGSFFDKIKDKLRSLNELSEKLHIPLVALCLNFAIANPLIDKAVIGVDSLSNFNEIINSLHYMPTVEKIVEDLLPLKVDDEQIILPFHWKWPKETLPR